jgi:hypothetical protein
VGGDRGPRTRRLAALTVAEVRRLFNLIGLTRIAIDQGLHWSIWRRAHQAEARRHHFRRRLRLQMIQI